MFRIPALMNSMRCAAMASNAGLKQGSRFVRPMSISAARFTEDTATKEDQNIESLFNGEPSSRPQTETQQQFRRGNRTMACINRIELLGGVADSPSERTTRNGNNYLTFNMFTNVEFRKPDGTTDENVELHNVIVFGNLINYSRKNIQKGSRVIVTGRLHYSGSGQSASGRIPRTASIVADLVQVIAKPVSQNQGFESYN